MKTIKIFSAFSVLISMVAFLAACNQNDEILPSEGDEPVRFSAISNPETRSSFSNVLNGSKIERIDWVSGDKITIWSDHADDHTEAKLNLANYKVTADGTAADEKSRASVTTDGSTPLKWYGAGAFDNYQFWGVYPTSKVTIAKSGNNAATGTDASFSANIPSTQAISAHKYPENVVKYEPSMDYAFMAAYLSTPKTSEALILPFWPSFTAFEINVKSADAEFELVDFTISTTDDSPIAGDFVATWSGTSTELGGWKHAAGQTTASAVKTTFEAGMKINTEKDITFTVFALPITMTNLKLAFTIKNSDGTTSVKSIKLSKDGKALSFAGCQKHRINALAIPTGWKFSVITLNLEAIDWFVVEKTTDVYAQATQFEVTGTAELREKEAPELKQSWYVTKGQPFTITYKVFLPEGGKWSIVPSGDTDAFTIEGTTSGDIAAGANGTRVTLTITPTGDAGKTLYFKTYVKNKAGVEYSIDSETQLFDVAVDNQNPNIMRGFHKFTIKE